MIELTGESLGKRQQELNEKVLKAVHEKVDFNEIVALEEKSDVDKLFKIDLASHYKNINYIVEVIKCGDSLYISRALKHDWIYRDEYAHIMNPDNLHHEIFPAMSLKMKTKLIKSLATNIRSEKRAISFFDYFLRLKMNNLALKFILFTDESFKLNIIETNFDLINSLSNNLKNFIGNSFALAKAYMSKVDSFSKDYNLNHLTYLYWLDDEQYLNLFEDNIKTSTLSYPKMFGGGISKSIMTKHKARVLNLPMVYFKRIKKYYLTRLSTAEFAKQLLTVLCPESHEEFWKNDFYNSYKYLFDKIPSNEVFPFLKMLFISKFGNEPFEMNVNFYYYNYYKMLTVDEREQWALKHIEEGKELLGMNKDYRWYSFVNFEQAFKAIKNYMFRTTKEGEREEMLKVLVESARSQRDLEKLFNYFYERHVNESIYTKYHFINAVLEHKSVFEFDDPCWNSFNNIFHSMGVYKPSYNGHQHIRAMCIIYNSINNKEMSESLLSYLDSEFKPYDFKHYFKHINKEGLEKLYNYLYDYYASKFITIDGNDKDAIKQAKIKLIDAIMNIFEIFNKPKEVPSFALSFIQEHNITKYQSIHVKDTSLTEGDLLRLLKKDKTLLIEKLPVIQTRIDDCTFRLTRITKKIRIYFSNDLAKEFEMFFVNCLENIKGFNIYTMDNSVYGIFQVGEINFKLKFLNENKPASAKIDYGKTDQKLLRIQECICRYVAYSRPSLPLTLVLEYLKGDYVHYCLPMFNMYLANLPLPLANKFIESILDAPVSVQKHGIRLALQLYNADNLKSVMSGIWKGTKNVSLRCVIYKALVKKMNESVDTVQNELIEPLIMLTSTLNENDSDELFDILSSDNIPQRFKSDVLKTAWMAVKNLSHKKIKNIIIKNNIIRSIKDYCSEMRDFCRSEILNEHVENQLCKGDFMKNFKTHENDLHVSLWDLTAIYIVTCSSQGELEKSLELLEIILQECFKNWNTVVGDCFVFAKHFYSFVENLKKQSFNRFSIYLVLVLERVLKSVEEYSPSEEIFELMLDLKLHISLKKAATGDIKDIETLAKLASNSVDAFIQELKGKNQLLPSFFQATSKLILYKVNHLATAMNMDSDILTALVCNELACSACIEVVVYAISVLPVQPTWSQRDKYKHLTLEFIKKLKSINNFEVQSFYYNKFILGEGMKV